METKKNEVTVEKAVESLQSLGDVSRVFAQFKTERKEDNTALFIIGLVDHGNGEHTASQTLIGKGIDALALLVLAMKKQPDIRTLVLTAAEVYQRMKTEKEECNCPACRLRRVLDALKKG